MNIKGIFITHDVSVATDRQLPIHKSLNRNYFLHIHKYMYMYMYMYNAHVIRICMYSYYHYHMNFSLFSCDLL